MIMMDRDFLNKDGSIPGKLIRRCIEIHKKQVTRFEKLDQYYDGEHAINSRQFSDDSLPNNKLICNHAAYITDMAVGYVFGVPVQYTGTGAEELNKHYTAIDEDSHNNELALDISIFGHGLELNYMSDEEKPQPLLACLSPLNSFLVVDNTVQHKPLFACTYNKVVDIDGNDKGFDIVIYTENQEITYHSDVLETDDFGMPTEEKEHFFQGIQVIEYQNNKRERGDFEPVITLIDAYNKLQSDRVNDKEQLVDALLAVSNVTFGDTEEEMTATAKLLKKMKILELPEGADAKWLVKNMNETEVEVLKKAIKDDIHEFSKVPCLTDENFVGNASGVAMKYKLLGLEQLGKTKERYFKKGLRQRLKLISNINTVKAKNTDLTQLDVVMKRSLPVDDELLARIAQETADFISWETRVQRFDPELDIEMEKERLDKEKEDAVKRQQAAFGNQPNNPPDGDVDEEE
ncbi:phage portal protein [Candidatus Galacturonibacter soehngenii]|uniref:Phage portal protein n=1 Tax=Candidatus Galacturonatibacter soehngenii TaxID=2307010 RepID=A0A7V7UB36_9FIRM|nr:phage portal protein [Candidatus Galacturonibacter soehngenii]KAB1437570.1 phage portal protein [Candidatus Galacturonibacter soehngenii]